MTRSFSLIFSLLLYFSHPFFAFEQPYLHKRPADQSEDAPLTKKQKISSNQGQNLDPQALLTKGVRENSLGFIKKAIELNANVNAKTPSKYTPLTEAAHSGNFEAVKILVNYGADVNLTGKYGLTPLTAAIGSATNIKKIEPGTQIALHLIEHGADINKPGIGQCSGQTPLYFALKYNYTELAKKLITLGAAVNVDHKKNKYSLLTIAIQNNSTNSHDEIINLLIEKGAIVNYQPRNFEMITPEMITPIAAAIRNNNTKVAKLLVKRGAKLNSSLLADAYNTRNEEMAYIFLSEMPNTSNSPNITAPNDIRKIKAYKIKQMIRAKRVELLEIE